MQRVRPGVGISWSHELAPLLAAQPALVDWVEFEPQTTWLAGDDGRTLRAPSAMLDRLLQAPGRKLVHSVAAPVGGQQRPGAQHLALLREAVRVLGAPYASEHLSFNAAHGVCAGFFLPPRQTQAQVRVIADNILRLQDALGVPVAIENGTSYLRPRRDEMPDGEFIARVAEAADCGLLLDLHNAYTNAVNGRQPLNELLAELPLQRVWELHLAGGMERAGFWLDAHSGAVPDALWAQVHDLPQRLPALQAVVFEMFPSFLAERGTEVVATELQHLRAWLDGATEAPVPTKPDIEKAPLVLVTEPLAAADDDDGDAWESALTALVTGQPVHGPDTTRTAAWHAALSPEAGVPLLQDLVFSFRASMVLQVLPLTLRLLMANLGPQAVRTILNDSFAHQAPRLYALLEAEAFSDHMQWRDLKVPHLAEVLRYEMALTHTLMDGQSRVVPFTVEPMPLLRALAEGRLPEEVPWGGNFEVALVGEEVGALAS